MKVSDLGVIDGPVLLFGGPYSNAQATRALVEKAGQLGVAAAICTGDVVAYCGAPRETVDLIRDFGCTVVAGNCEKQLASGADHCGCGFDEGSACDLLADGWYGFASSRMRPADRAWMADCPDLVTFTHLGRRFAVIHGGFTDVARFVWPVSDDAVLREEITAIEARIGHMDAVVAGHTGFAFQRTVGHVDWINAGVIGMPSHDGRNTTRFMVLDKGRVEVHALAYDVTGAVRDMEKAGLTQGYHNALRTGYWPSEDVLPAELRVSSPARG